MLWLRQRDRDRQAPGSPPGNGTGRPGLGKLRNIVRQELLARQLDQELPPPPVRIIDLGCGQGTQALRLARRGYEVTGVDASADRISAGYGVEVTAWYGVRVFTDTADDDAAAPPDLAALLDCEERAGRTGPYRQVAALLHLVARRAAGDPARWS